MKAIIVGGGIGGLVTALRLHQVGVEVKVFESVSTVKPLGVGINLLPHAVRVLTNIGLQDKMQAMAVETKELVYANRYGQFFWEEPRGKYAGYRWPQYSVHRGSFQMLLWEHALEVLGKDRLFTNCHFDSYEQNDNEVTAHFSDKEIGEIVLSETADILIGADGIHSRLRKLLYPNEGPVVFSGNILYRGTTLMKPFATGSSMAMIGSLKQKMVIYPISKDLDENGNQLINWVANLKDTKNTKLTVRDWNREVSKDQLLEIYKTWRFDWIDVVKMIEDAAAIYEFPMSDRDPLDQWTFGRVSLLGDAAHPMYPIGSNGASQAILDADALANAIESNQNVKEALIAYDAERVPAAAAVVKQNRQKGPDFIMDLMEDRFPEGFTKEQIPHQELSDVMAHYKKVAGFDMQTLNQKS
jgi:2-polyprenyl-6-methoxyphenol hydroxylase-like FAD-dependent oxidoreductase